MCTSESKCQMNENCTPKSDDFWNKHSIDIDIYNSHICSTQYANDLSRVNGGRILLGERERARIFWVRSRHNKHTQQTHSDQRNQNTINIYWIYWTTKRQCFHIDVIQENNNIHLQLKYSLFSGRVFAFVYCFVHSHSLSLSLYLSLVLCVYMFVCFVACVCVLSWRKRIVALDTICVSITAT